MIGVNAYASVFGTVAHFLSLLLGSIFVLHSLCGHVRGVRNDSLCAVNILCLNAACKL